MLTVFGILFLMVVIGIALVALLPSLIGAIIPTVVCAGVAWIAYRFARKGMKKIKDITK